MTNCGKLILFFLGSLLYSCGSGNSPHPVAAPNDNRVENYRKFINTLDTTNAGTALLAAQKYKELFSNNDTLVNDRAYALFEKYYAQLMNGLNEHFRSDANINKIPRTFVATDMATYPPRLAKYADTLKENGFEFIYTEGDLEIVQKRDFIIQWFYPSVSATIKQYLDEVDKENKEGLAEDEALLISATDLSQRAAWWENFTASYPHFVLINEAIRQKKLYLTILLKGLDNSPVLNYDSHKLTEYYKGAYKYLILKYPNTIATRMVKPYYEALSVNDTLKANQIIRQYNDEKLLLWQ